MIREGEEQVVLRYKDYYCDQCGKYIGRWEREYDRLYKIRITTLSVPSLNLEMNRCFCCKECENKADNELIGKLRSIGFDDCK